MGPASVRLQRLEKPCCQRSAWKPASPPALASAAGLAAVPAAPLAAPWVALAVLAALEVADFESEAVDAALAAGCNWGLSIDPLSPPWP